MHTAPSPASKMRQEVKLEYFRLRTVLVGYGGISAGRRMRMDDDHPVYDMSMLEQGNTGKIPYK